MSNYEQKYTSSPHIEIVPDETLSEKQCYHLQELLIEVTFRYLEHIGKNHTGVSCTKNTGVNCYAPLEFRDECGMSVVKLSDLEIQQRYKHETIPKILYKDKIILSF